jgi:imidazolonepropionase-like amidohydrolase
MKFALAGGLVIDGSGGAPQANRTVVIDGSKIVDICGPLEPSSDLKIVDVRGKVLMPGMIDTHNHMAPWGIFLASSQQDHLLYQASKTAYNMMSCLEAGCTSVRDLGGLEAGIVRAQREGLLPGPRLQTSVCIIQPTNGLMDGAYMPVNWFAVTPQGFTAHQPGVPSAIADGPWGVRQKVREVLRAGADLIKIANCQAPFAKPSAPEFSRARSVFTREELDALVDEAHRAGAPVSVHSNFIPSTLEAVLAGVDTIEHGTIIDDRCAEEMARRGVFLIPTITNIMWHYERTTDPGARAALMPLVDGLRNSFSLALKHGVPIAMGTDAAWASGLIGGELDYMVKLGMTPMQAIVASTHDAAKCMRLDDRTGVLRRGMEADLLVLSANPLEDMSLLADRSKIELVLLAGKPVAGPMTHLFAWEPRAPMLTWPI